LRVGRVRIRPRSLQVLAVISSSMKQTWKFVGIRHRISHFASNLKISILDLHSLTTSRWISNGDRFTALINLFVCVTFLSSMIVLMHRNFHFARPKPIRLLPLRSPSTVLTQLSRWITPGMQSRNELVRWRPPRYLISSIGGRSAISNSAIWSLSQWRDIFRNYSHCSCPASAAKSLLILDTKTERDRKLEFLEVWSSLEIFASITKFMMITEWIVSRSWSRLTRPSSSSGRAAVRAQLHYNRCRDSRRGCQHQEIVRHSRAITDCKCSTKPNFVFEVDQRHHSIWKTRCRRFHHGIIREFRNWSVRRIWVAVRSNEFASCWTGQPQN
jgi:hypothetical protein